MESLYTIKAAEYGISPLPENPVVAMAYVPFQQTDRIYSAEQGLNSGTMFPVLDKPFIGCGGSRR